MSETKLIICPVDFSEFSVRAYRHALSLAEHYRAKLVALHVVELWRYPYADYAASAGDYAEFCRVLQEGGKEQLREFAKKHTDNQIEPEARSAPGNGRGLYSVICAIAQSGPDRHGHARPARI